MRWFRTSQVRWAIALVGLLATGCVGAIGLGTAAVAVGAGVLAFTCYDRVSITVTDRLTGTKLCDAKVSFFEGTSETVATPCYEAALSKGKYKLRVERPGLAPFEQPVEVVDGNDCGQTVQTMVVAMDRLDRVPPPQLITPAKPAPVEAPPAAEIPAPAPVPAPAAPLPSAVPAPSGEPAGPPLAPPPASGGSAAK
jgi:hypothetical protein